MAATQGLNGKLVTVFGGSGFLGRHVVRALARRGYRVRAAVRRPDLAHHLQPLGGVGQIAAVQANLRYPSSVARAIEGADAVVNAVGILFETRKQSFDLVQADGPRTIAEAASAAGIARITHVSAIGACSSSASDYARSKAEGERGVFETLPESTILRPSIIFGPEDGFFNKFAAIARLSPVVPIVGGKTRFQPVFVGDVAEVVARSVDGALKAGATYELGGPDVASFRALIELMLEITNRKRMIVDLPVPVARLQAALLQWLPNPPLTVDQINLLGTDNVVSERAIAAGLTLEGLGMQASAMKAILPTYLWHFRQHGQFEKLRG